jgi:PsbP-like protein
MLFGTVIIMLLVVSLPLITSISYNTLPPLLNYQQAMAQKTATTNNSTISTQQPNEDAFLTYTNSTYGIRIQFPSDWLYKGSEASNDSVQAIVTFASPKLLTSSSNKSLLVLSIGMEKLPFYNMPLDLYTNLTIDHLRESEPGFRLLGSEEITFAGIKPAHKILFTSDSGLKTMAVYAIKGNKAYIIDYIAGSEATYSSYTLIAQIMIDSFQIIK